MERKIMSGARIGAVFCILLLTLSTFLVFGHAEAQDGSTTQLEGVDVSFDTSEYPKVTLSKGMDHLYSIEYRELDTPKGLVPLNTADWDIKKKNISDERFSHMRIKLDRQISDGNFSAHLSLTINVISISDTSEVTFSFSLDNIDGLPSGNVLIIQNIDAKGQIVSRPHESKGGKEPIEYYEFSFSSGHTGYYSWNLEAQMNGNTSQAISIPSDGGSLFLGSHYDSEADRLSISSMDMDKTRMSTVVPIPETYSHFPSFMIGVLIGSSFVTAFVIEKRREFYESRDSRSVVKLEESSYYKGKE